MSAKRLNLIQVFRGLAAVLVVFAHTDLIYNQNVNQDFLFKMFLFGGSGVDFFFVLSGFIMFYIHYKDIGHPDKLGTFFSKRFTRIYPLYWLILTSKILASFLFSYEPNTNARGIGEFIKAFLLFPQDRTILSSSFLGVSWTLSFEMFFYLMFGVLICLKPKFSFPIIVGWLSGVFLHFLGVIQFPQDNLLIQFLFSDYNLEFVLGSLAAYVVLNKKVSNGIPLLYGGLFLYTLSVINSWYTIIQLSSVVLFGIPCTLIVIGSASLELRKNINVPVFLVFLGNASYSVYLVHGFFMNQMTKILSKLPFPLFENLVVSNIVGFIISIIAIMCGCVIYSYIEKPLLTYFKPKAVTT
ncbi:acyltransferase family protein [Brasilonema bromeliae]|uniref:Acyltransferase n=1 Tax=Brasilonema bromeliae SPC951 TaxID=385972 RepID=A0ABX1P3Q6_9CYAN|nr:acyltransferase [Brasilonema bromeliae]NMG18517.1 acyltransferase [Brasilonema bromeliae SPC951]